MKAFAITNQGIEDICATEVKELVTATDIRSSSGLITFSVSDVKDFCTLAYRSQSVSRLCYLICEFDAASSLAAAASSLKQKIKNFRMGEWISNSDSFVVECDRFGSHDFNSLDFSTEANKIISEISGNSNVSFKSPLMRFFCYINGSKGYFGVDVSGFDLGKREYRIFGHASDLKATVAYALVRLSGFKPKSALLDPFCRSGAIAIEAALFASRFPVNYYRRDSFSFRRLKPFSKISFQKFFASLDKGIRKERQPIFNFSPSITHVVSSEKNAKIAGVNKLISFSRVDTEWLELKFDMSETQSVSESQKLRNSKGISCSRNASHFSEPSVSDDAQKLKLLTHAQNRRGGFDKEKVDVIVSFPPMLSRNVDSSKIKKLYSEFFYQANLILSKKGKIVLAASDAEALKEAAAARNFVLESKLEFSMGSEKRLALAFGRA